MITTAPPPLPWPRLRSRARRLRQGAPRSIGNAARFFLTRHCERTAIGPYVVTTTEARPRRFETSVTWGQAGPEVEAFGSGVAFDLPNAKAVHAELCQCIEEITGRRAVPISLDGPSAA